ncbi:MAG: hypothetical protein IJ866_01235 [Alphaproteobacteria bacterium]|nr:hypothetical protein [Alphaproteobacteria bacterium]
MKKIFLSVSLISLCSCATIVDGGPDTINFMTSDGSNVKAQITTKAGTQTMMLPTMMSVPKSCKDIQVQVVEDKKTRMSYAVADSQVNGWVFGNIIFGGLIGLAVDAATGNVCTYPSNVVVPVNHK